MGLHQQHICTVERTRPAPDLLCILCRHKPDHRTVAPNMTRCTRGKVYQAGTRHALYSLQTQSRSDCCAKHDSVHQGAPWAPEKQQQAMHCSEQHVCPAAAGTDCIVKVCAQHTDMCLCCSSFKEAAYSGISAGPMTPCFLYFYFTDVHQECLQPGHSAGMHASPVTQQDNVWGNPSSNGRMQPLCSPAASSVCNNKTAVGQPAMRHSWKAAAPLCRHNSRLCLQDKPWQREACTQRLLCSSLRTGVQTQQRALDAAGDTSPGQARVAWGGLPSPSIWTLLARRLIAGPGQTCRPLGHGGLRESDEIQNRPNGHRLGVDSGTWGRSLQA